MNAEAIRKAYTAVMEEIERVIVGKREVLARIMAVIFSSGHVLIEDNPGLAKTLTASTLSKTMGCAFRRVQFTPDLLPSDITGAYVLNRRSGDFEFRQGPLFANLLLADEINRAPPRTQSALLEAMNERQVTVEGNSFILERPFTVMATQNPIEYEGTYPLPEAQLDRFLARVSMGYPLRDAEIRILRNRRERKKDEFEIRQIITKEELIEIQKSVEDIFVSDEMEGYITDIVRQTREHPSVEIGASPRGSLGLMKMSMAVAAMDGRDFVIPDDVKLVAPSVLSHRIILKPDPWLSGTKTEDVVDEVLRNVQVPKVS